ncbi:hypothetical protein C2S51_034836 [Perilla frutescens var. frutescens]|nr:hypothetical protein C2S51_034836 [Perilla frutescens var. frutescens]
MDEGVLSILRGGEGWDEQYSDIDEFKHHLNQAYLKEDESSNGGWVLRNECDSNNTKITTLLKYIASNFWFSKGNHCLVQFWVVVKVEGRDHYLSTSNQPFYVGKLNKGVSWYRNLCVGLVYHVDLEGAEAEQLLGGVGRAYRNKRPESTPDLRLYSINEFPLRDQAARDGFKSYLALPIYDSHQNQCHGVLELLCDYPSTDTIFFELEREIKLAGLRYTHVNFNIPVYLYRMSESNFTAYLETDDSCCLKLPSRLSHEGWVICRPAEEKLVENDVKSNSLLLPISIKEKIEDFMKQIPVRYWIPSYWMVQFWAPKMGQDMCYLETSDQPYAVGCLARGLASFRKECIKHHYFVDEETKEEELGPPGRVFRNGHPESTPDLYLYSTKEFSRRNYAVHCGLKEYFALPVFEKLESECVGVLEVVGLDYHSKIGDIATALEEAKLHSIIHRNFPPLFIAKQNPTSVNLYLSSE